MILSDILLQRCANPMSPKGGPKDTIPPTLLEVSPITGTTNFNEQEITLVFDEFINADKLKQNLVITPKSNFVYKHQVKRMELTLKFEDPFLDSTTYSLNFFDGVTDITEKNPVINLYIAFSTGSFIDSMKVQGNVSDLISQDMMKGYTVGLYPISDSLDFLKHNPTYFTTTDTEGFYEINYIKSGKYKIISFDDENRNLLLDPETESHGFISDTLNLFSVDSTIHEIRTQLLNVKPITYINARPTGQYIEAKYSREIDNYTISPDTIKSIIVGDKKDGIRIYNNNQFAFNDSVQFVLNTYDSLGNNTIDTVKTIFLDSNRKLPSFSTTIETKANQKLIKNQIVKVKFNKPIESIDSNLFVLKKDSTFLYGIKPSFLWNSNKDLLEIQTNINIDSVITDYQKSIPEDTTSMDSISGIKIDKEPVKKDIIYPTLEFIMKKGAFMSIENDTSKTRKLSFKTDPKQSYGSLSIKVETDETSFTLQLLSKGKVAYQSENKKKISFPRVIPGNYNIRVLIDNNNDGNWSFGNILKNKEPESLYLYEDEISLRENWVVDDIIVSF